jgi:Alpha/beta hydrolase family
MWIRKPIGVTSVVFVHGILSSGEKCWRHENGVFWPELLEKEADLEKLGIYVFTYQTSIFSGSYRLSDAVDALKEHMRLDGLLESEGIIFVCHSMGGIVVRKFLVERAADLIERKTAVGLFLVASPSLGSSYANWLSPLAQFLGHAQADVLRFQQDNAWLSDLDKEFQNLKENGKLRILGKELIEDKFVVLSKLWRKQVVESFSGARYFGEQFKVPESNHFSIAKPDSKTAIQHRLLCHFVRSMPVDSQSTVTEDVHAQAVALDISCDQDVFSLGALNIGTHVIRDIEINAIPDAEDWHEATHGCLPKVETSYTHGVEVVYPIAGGWLYAKVAQLNPNRGFMVATFQIERGDYTKIDFDVFWNDHTGMQRKSHAVVDVASVTGDLPLKPRRAATRPSAESLKQTPREPRPQAAPLELTMIRLYRPPTGRRLQFRIPPANGGAILAFSALVRRPGSQRNATSMMPFA